MRATRNSKSSPASSQKTFPAAGVFCLLLVLGSLWAGFVWSQGWTLYYGDAESHLNIARRILDSRTPGYDQIGTGWLPLPHLLMMPFAANDWLWRSGVAGAIPGVFCYALAGTAMFLMARRLFASTAAAVCATLLLALNPNLLYLQSAPMNEPIVMACILWMLYFTIVFADTGSMGAVAGAGLCSAAACLTRYEGWFLIPFVCGYLVVTGGDKRWKAAFLFGAIASLAPLWWLSYNAWYYGNPLDFYEGPYSAKAIQRRSDGGTHNYPGYGDWAKSILYYRTAAWLCSGTVLVVLGLAGSLAALWKRAWWPLALLSATLVFYVMSLHGSDNPIFVPGLWPHSYYNTRYGMPALPLLAFAASALVAIIPARAQRFVAAGLVIAVLIPWLVYPRPDNWITWKESQVNSIARRAWTNEAGNYLASQYAKGDGVYFPFGDATGILRVAGIPLREGFHEGNGPHSLAVSMRPDLFLWEPWVVAIAGDHVSSEMMKLSNYRKVRTVQVKDAPAIHIYRRIDSPNP